jgi:hypothetical protein
MWILKRRWKRLIKLKQSIISMMIKNNELFLRFLTNIIMNKKFCNIYILKIIV